MRLQAKRLHHKQAARHDPGRLSPRPVAPQRGKPPRSNRAQRAEAPRHIGVGEGGSKRREVRCGGEKIAPEKPGRPGNLVR